MVTKAKNNIEKKNKTVEKKKVNIKAPAKKVVAKKSPLKTITTKKVVVEKLPLNNSKTVKEKNNQPVTNKKTKQDKNNDTINKKLTSDKINPKLTKEENNTNMINKVNAKTNNEKDLNKVEEIKEVVENNIDTSQMEEDRFDNTEVYDEGDIASALERGYINQALQKHKEKLAPETHPDFDGESCVSCGGEIPLLRLNMGKVRCVHCQEKLEKTKKMYAQK